MKNKKQIIVEIIPLTIAVLMSLYWIATYDKVSLDPYLLGLFRGFIWPTIILSHIRWWIN